MPVTSFLGVQLAQLLPVLPVASSLVYVLCLTLLVSNALGLPNSGYGDQICSYFGAGVGLLLCCSQCKAAGGCGFGVCWTRVRGGLERCYALHPYTDRSLLNIVSTNR